jgi:hypothetical protein
VSIIKKTGLLFALLMGISFMVYAQQDILNQPVSVSFHKLSVDSALRMLQNRTGFNLTYNARFLPQGKEMDANFDSIPLSIILDSIFGNPLLSYKIIDRQLVVLAQPKVGDSTYGPNATIYKRYSGRVVEAKTGKSLPYSSVGILHKGFGVISNKDGLFVIQIPNEFKRDTLAISYMGYYQKKVPVSVLQTFQTFDLQEKIVSLPEILIRNTSARGLVKKAISKISSNYYTEPFTIRGFYREIVKKNKRYMSYTEALLDIYKRPLRPTLYHDQVMVLKKRKYTDISGRDTVMFKLKGGLDAILQLDLVRNRPDFILLSRMNNYEFAMEDITMLDGHLVYVISFSPRTDKVLPALKGEIYIDATSLAMVQIQFHYARKSLQKMKVQYVLRSSSNVHAFPVLAKYQVSYQLFNGKYYIHYILGNIRFRVKQKHHWLRSIFDVSFEMMSTDINNSHPLRFAANETVKTNKVFSDFTTGYDIPYWKNANIIVPEADINRVLQGFKEKDLKIEQKKK